MRIKALIRRSKIPYSEVLHIGKLAIDNGSHMIYVDEDIAPKEKNISITAKLDKMTIAQRSLFLFEGPLYKEK